VRELDLPLMVRDKLLPFQTAFTISIEQKKAHPPAISASDRACYHTDLLIADDAKPEDLARPAAYISPFRQKTWAFCSVTVQTRIVDLSRLCWIKIRRRICEIMNEDGTMSRHCQNFENFAKEHGPPALCLLPLSYATGFHGLAGEACHRNHSATESGGDLKK